MAKQPRSKKPEDLHIDAWQRFERAVDVVIKSGPKHKVSPKAGLKRKKDSATKPSPKS